MGKNESLFDEYRRLAEAGLRSQAKVALDSFIASFSNLSEKIDWTDKNFDRLYKSGGYSIRYELYENVVFPALLHGYNQNCAEAKYRLARSTLNLYSAKHLEAQIGQGDYSLLNDAFQASPENERYREALLTRLLQIFDHLDHEWPAGILLNEWDPDEDWDQLFHDINLARTLDKDGSKRERLNQFESRVNEYLERRQRQR